MFKKKNKKKKRHNVTIYDNKHNIIHQGDITLLPIRDDCIIKLSIEYYNDPEPCMIHRSSILSSIYCKFIDFFDTHETDTVTLLDIPEELRNYVKIS